MPKLNFKPLPEKRKKREEPILMRKYVPVIPFPQRLKKSKLDAHFKDLWRC
ncbi:unnamed protein product [Rhodiola kirilowii]